MTGASDQQADIIATTVPPSNDLESAIVPDAAGKRSIYTAIVRGFNDATGIAVVGGWRAELVLRGSNVLPGSIRQRARGQDKLTVGSSPSSRAGNKNKFF